MGELVTYRLGEGIAEITLDDGKANVMSPAMMAQINAALDRAAADRAAVLLTGRPGMFSAGFDLAIVRGGEQAAAEAMFETGFELAARVLSFPAPVITACTGHAVAMGLFLMLSSDYIIAAAGPYKLAANEVSIGLTMPYTAIEILRQRLVPAAALRALTLSEPFTPASAVAAGMVDEVRPEVGLSYAARDVAARAAALDRDVLAASKQRIRERSAAAVRAAIDADRAARDARAVRDSVPAA
jgi:enoyl-CoA hydratase